MDPPAERCGWSMGAGIAGRGLVSNRSCYRCLGRFAKILGRNDGDFDFDFDFEVRGYSRWCIGWIMISRHRLRIMDQIPFDIVYGIEIGNGRRYGSMVDVNEEQARILFIVYPDHTKCHVPLVDTMMKNSCKYVMSI